MDRQVDPGHFDGPLTPHGDGALTVAVGGIAVRFEGLSAPLLAAALERYGPFLSDETPVHTVRLCEGPDDYLDMAEDKFLRLEEARFPEGRTLVSHVFAAYRPDHASREGILKLHPATPEDPSLGALENYLRWVVADLALDRRGFVLHAAGLVRDGKGYVFFGPSGAGKSTLAGMSDGCELLSDDLVLIKERAGAFHVASTPFAGTLPQSVKRPGLFPLRGLYRLRQAPRHEVHALRPRSVAVASILSCCPFVADPSARRDRLLPLVETCCAAVPVGELEFLKDPGFWAML